MFGLFLFSSYLFFIPTKNKRNWLFKVLNENDLGFKNFLGFVLVENEDKEFIDYLIPNSFLKIKDVFFKKDFTSESLQYIYEKDFSIKEVNVFSELIEYITENGEFDLLLNTENNQCEFHVFYADTKDVVFSKIINLNNCSDFEDELKDFIYSDVKIGKKAFEKIKNDVFNYYLSGFDINFEAYSINITRNNGDDFSITLQHTETLRRIVIKHAKINEKNGVVSFAGSGDSVLYF